MAAMLDRSDVLIARAWEAAGCRARGCGCDARYLPGSGEIVVVHHDEDSQERRLRLRLTHSPTNRVPEMTASVALMIQTWFEQLHEGARHPTALAAVSA